MTSATAYPARRKPVRLRRVILAPQTLWAKRTLPSRSGGRNQSSNGHRSVSVVLSMLALPEKPVANCLGLSKEDPEVTSNGITAFSAGWRVVDIFLDQAKT
jgi:hypothetical protein